MQSLNLRRTLSLQRLSKENLLSTFSFEFCVQYLNIIHEKAQISDKLQTFSSESTLQRKKHRHLDNCHTLEKQRKQLSKIHINGMH